MDDTQHVRAAERSPAEQSDESREQPTSVVLTGRLLANPRRVRRN